MIRNLLLNGYSAFRACLHCTSLSWKYTEQIRMSHEAFFPESPPESSHKEIGFEEGWTQLKAAITAIVEKKSQSTSQETLYQVHFFLIQSTLTHCNINNCIEARKIFHLSSKSVFSFILLSRVIWSLKKKTSGGKSKVD